MFTRCPETLSKNPRAGQRGQRPVSSGSAGPGGCASGCRFLVWSWQQKGLSDGVARLDDPVRIGGPVERERLPDGRPDGPRGCEVKGTFGEFEEIRRPDGREADQSHLTLSRVGLVDGAPTPAGCAMCHVSPASLHQREQGTRGVASDPVEDHGVPSVASAWTFAGQSSSR